MARVAAPVLEQLRQCQQDRERSVARLGILALQWHQAVKHADHEVMMSERAQRQIGEAALRALGFDPEREDLTVDLETGAVLRLVDGRWAATPPEGAACVMEADHRL